MSVLKALNWLQLVHLICHSGWINDCPECLLWWLRKRGYMAGSTTEET